MAILQSTTDTEQHTSPIIVSQRTRYIFPLAEQLLFKKAVPVITMYKFCKLLHRLLYAVPGSYVFGILNHLEIIY